MRGREGSTLCFGLKKLKGRIADREFRVFRLSFVSH